MGSVFKKMVPGLLKERATHACVESTHVQGLGCSLFIRDDPPPGSGCKSLRFRAWGVQPESAIPDVSATSVQEYLAHKKLLLPRTLQ